jgi:hypothetical protein
MRLADLLAELPVEQLERLGAEHIGADAHVSRAALCSTLEGVLRSYSFVRKFVGDCLPPTFAILEILLDAETHSWNASTFRDVVAERAKGLAESVASGELVGRDSSLRLYRRVLIEARRNDLTFDASESAILGVLRRELSIRPVEHFLIEHHPDFNEFSKGEHAFLDAMTSLRSAGVVFGHSGQVLLAEEVVPVLRQALGMEMPAACRRRLYACLSGADLSGVLTECGLKSSGSRDEKLERLLASYIQPREVLRHQTLQTLRDLCREVNVPSSGSKDELVERVAECFLHGMDVRPADEEAPIIPAEPEPRVLSERSFRALFAALKGDELSDILAGIGSSRITGAKETKIALLVGSRFSEVSLLEHLTNRSLEDILARHRLRTAGSKRERSERMIDFFHTNEGPAIGMDAEPVNEPAGVGGDTNEGGTS